MVDLPEKLKAYLYGQVNKVGFFIYAYWAVHLATRLFHVQILAYIVSADKTEHRL